MGESRAKRKARLAVPELDLGPRRALTQIAGEVLLSGDRALAAQMATALEQRERVDRATHGFHTWPAGLHPDAARIYLSLGSGPVLDPFCGGGTVLVEAMLAGRSALGLDINPIANLVARARTVLTTEAERTAMRSLARKATEAGMHAAPGGPPHDWYTPQVVGELTAIQAVIGKDPLLRAVFSSILVRVSQRRSDTSNQRTDDVRPPQTTSTLFHKKAREYGRLLEALASAVPEGVRARVHREDAREFRGKDIGQVVTSPPYPGVYDYVPMQSLRYGWLGIDPGDAVREEIGSRRSFRADRTEGIAAWRADANRWVRAMSKSLAPGGRLVVVVGDGIVGGRPIDSFSAIDEAARAHGLRFLARATVERWDEGLESVRPEHAGLWEHP